MTADTYTGFAELARCEKAGADYRISISNVGSAVTIVAPHGGKIEPGTSEIAREIAAEDYNCYCFEGIKTSLNGRLHITSHRFDEPAALKLISASDIVVAVHACTGTAGLVYLGGLDTPLKKAIATDLKNRGIGVSIRNSRFKGANPDNICNRGRTCQGVQLEITRDLRDDPIKKAMIAEAVRASLSGCGRMP
ncbi:MAG: poly-gamma-glutamate hydrolase family protein [Thermodesulfobacteriota bacterium]